MAITAGVVFALVISITILIFAMAFHRRQIILNQKRAEYLTVKRDNAAHWKRFETCQVEIDRYKADVKLRSRDLNVMIVEMDKKRHEIRDVLEILRDENDQAENDMDRELTKILERRKGILRGHWKELNGMKTLFIQKMADVSQLKSGIDSVVVRKDDEYQKWAKTKIKMDRLKNEFEAVSRSSLFSLSGKH
ncbi:hypothetical protein LLH00_16350 [bacterium]|nr:hypothetical protein [bacterium]